MASPPVTDDLSQAGRRAKIRIGIALALLVTAIGILTFLNQSRTTTEPLPEAAQTPAQVSMSSQETEKPVEPEPPKVPDATPPPPVDAAQTAAEPLPVAPPPPPQVSGKPALEQNTKVPAKAVAEKPKAVTNKPAPTVTKTVEPAATKPAPQVAAKPVAEAKPAAKAAAEPAPVKPAAEPGKIAAPKGFEVQLGVFSDMENAKQLQTKLAEHGIPSHTETRVQIGPFKTRAEADQAKEKLKALGISGVIAPK